MAVASWSGDCPPVPSRALPVPPCRAPLGFGGDLDLDLATGGGPADGIQGARRDWSDQPAWDSSLCVCLPTS
jgi:hypothetical protein